MQTKVSLKHYGLFAVVISFMVYDHSAVAQVVTRSGEKLSDAIPRLRTAKESIPQTPEKEGYTLSCYHKSGEGGGGSYLDWYFVKNRKTLEECRAEEQASRATVRPAVEAEECDTADGKSFLSSNDGHISPEGSKAKVIALSSRNLATQGTATPAVFQTLDGQYPSPRVYVIQPQKKGFAAASRNCVNKAPKVILASLEIKVPPSLPKHNDNGLESPKVDQRFDVDPAEKQSSMSVLVPKSSPSRLEEDAGIGSNKDLLGIDVGDKDYDPSQVNRYLDTAPPAIKQLARNAALKYKINPRLVLSMIAVESGFNPNAVSPRGATGLMQLMPATAAELGLKGDEIRNPAKNIEAGVKYLDQLLKRYRNNVPMALAAYNAGFGAVDRAGRIPQNGETPNYVRDIMRLFTQTQPEIQARLR